MTLRILSAGAVTGLIDALRGRFESETGVTLEPHYRAVGVIGELLDGGEECDIVISSDAQIANYVEAGRLEGETVARIGSVHTAVAVPEGSPRPDISSGPAFLEALRNATEIYHPDMKRGTAGIHLARILDETCLRSLVEPRLHSFANGATTMKNLAGGHRGAIGLAQATEILHSTGVEYVGPFPPEYALATPYSIAASVRATRHPATKSFIHSLVSKGAAEERRKSGFV